MAFRRWSGDLWRKSLKRGEKVTGVYDVNVHHLTPLALRFALQHKLLCILFCFILFFCSFFPQSFSLVEPVGTPLRVASRYDVRMHKKSRPSFDGQLRLTDVTSLKLQFKFFK